MSAAASSYSHSYSAPLYVRNAHALVYHMVLLFTSFRKELKWFVQSLNRSPAPRMPICILVSFIGKDRVEKNVCLALYQTSQSLHLYGSAEEYVHTLLGGS